MFYSEIGNGFMVLGDMLTLQGMHLLYAEGGLLHVGMDGFYVLPLPDGLAAELTDPRYGQLAARNAGDGRVEYQVFTRGGELRFIFTRSIAELQPLLDFVMRLELDREDLYDLVRGVLISCDEYRCSGNGFDLLLTHLDWRGDRILGELGEEFGRMGLLFEQLHLALVRELMPGYWRSCYAC